MAREQPGTPGMWIFGKSLKVSVFWAFEVSSSIEAGDNFFNWPCAHTNLSSSDIIEGLGQANKFSHPLASEVPQLYTSKVVKPFQPG